MNNPAKKTAGIIFVLLLVTVTSCNFFGPFDNPVDPEAENWQGYFSIYPETLAVGRYHMLISDSGATWAWGANWEGRLGVGHTESCYSPVRVSYLDGISIVGTAAGDGHSLAWDSEGNLWGWGDNRLYQLGNDADGYNLEQEYYKLPVLVHRGVAMAACGSEMTAALETDGGICVWGSIPANEDTTLFYFQGIHPESLVIPGGRSATMIACSEYNGLAALAEDGTVWQWGFLNEDNTFHGDFEQVIGIGEAENITGGGGHFMAELSDGTLYTWGAFFEKTAWDDTYPAASGFSSIAAGYDYSLALTDGGSLFGWGSNETGQLGLPFWQFTVSEPVQIADGYEGAEVVADWHNTFVYLPGGSLYIWGSNDDGQLGIGKEGAPDMSLSEFVVDFGSDVEIVAADGGANFGVAVDSGGNVWTWGHNAGGRLGLGDTNFRKEPEKISSPGDVEMISVGGDFVIAADSSGYLWSWGENSRGELGLGDEINRMSPSEITAFGSGGINKIVSGYEHTLALDGDGAVWAWGQNFQGKLGLGDNASRSSPEQVTFPGIRITDISCGGYHSMALDENGDVWTWGDNQTGELGDGTNTNSNVPVKIESMKFGNQAVTAIKAGSWVSFAVTEDGRLWGWGHNNNLGMDEEILVPLVIGSPAAVRDIGIAGQATLICTEDGSVYVNGRFLSQTLWQYDTGDEVDMPGAVGDFFLSDLWSNRNIRSLSGGADHNTRGNHFFLIDADGVLYAF